MDEGIINQPAKLKGARGNLELTADRITWREKNTQEIKLNIRISALTNGRRILQAPYYYSYRNSQQ